MTENKKRFGHPKFYELLDTIADLHSRKNHDYSGEGDPLKNLRAPSRIGVDPFTGVVVRLQDKWSRLEQFMNSKELLVKGESVKDTLMDNAVYSLLAIILFEEQEQKESTPGYGGDVVTKLCADCKHVRKWFHEPPCDICGEDIAKDKWEPKNGQ